jgi:hypothetical protein
MEKNNQDIKEALAKITVMTILGKALTSFIGAVLATVFTSLLVGLFVQLLANSLIASFGPLSSWQFYAPVGYWQSVKLVLLCSFLFKGCSVKS